MEAPVAPAEFAQANLPAGTLHLDHRYHDDAPLAGATYVLRLSSGEERTGVLDARGQASIADVPGGSYTVRFGPAQGDFERKDKTPTPGHDPDPDPDKAKLSAWVSKRLSALTGASDPGASDTGVNGSW